MAKNDNRVWDINFYNFVLFCMKNQRFVQIDNPTDQEEKRLSDWITVQIGEHKRGNLNKYKTDRLNGFSPDILNCKTSDMYKAVTEQIKRAYVSTISPAMQHSGITDKQMIQLHRIGIDSDIEASNSIAWATLVLSSPDDIEVNKEDKLRALNILKAIGIVSEDNRIIIRSKLARNLAARLDTTFEANSLYLIFAILGPESAWRVIFNGSKQEQMCARIRELVIKHCDSTELQVIATRYYSFKSIDDVARLLGKETKEIKDLEKQAINKINTVACKEYVINNMLTEANGSKVDAGMLTNFEIATTHAKIKSAIKE